MGLNADDLLTPERIERQVHLMKANPDMGIVAVYAESILRKRPYRESMEPGSARFA